MKHILESKGQSEDVNYWKKEAVRYKHRAKRLRKSSTTKLRSSIKQLCKDDLFDITMLFTAVIGVNESDKNKLIDNIVSIIYPNVNETK